MCSMLSTNFRSGRLVSVYLGKFACLFEMSHLNSRSYVYRLCAPSLLYVALSYSVVFVCEAFEQDQLSRLRGRKEFNRENGYSRPFPKYLKGDTAFLEWKTHGADQAAPFYVRDWDRPLKE